MNSTLSVIVKTNSQDNSTEEHVAQSNNTKKFSAEVDINQFKFGPETNRTILIYIYNFTTPLTIKVMHPWSFLTNHYCTTEPLVMNIKFYFSGDRHATCSYELTDLFLGLFRLLFVSFTYCRHCLEGLYSVISGFTPGFTSGYN